MLELTAKHRAILLAFDGFGGYYERPQFNARVHVWDQIEEKVIVDFTHIAEPDKSPFRDMTYEAEWEDLVREGLVVPISKSTVFFKLTDKGVEARD